MATLNKDETAISDSFNTIPSFGPNYIFYFNSIQNQLSTINHLAIDTSKTISKEITGKVIKNQKIFHREEQDVKEYKEQLKKIIGSNRLKELNDMLNNEKVEELKKSGEINDKNPLILKRHKSEKRDENNMKKRILLIENNEEFTKKKEEATAFIKKIQKDKTVWKKNEAKRLNSIAEKRRKEIEEKEDEIAQKEFEVKKKRREESEKLFQKLKQKREEEKKIFDERFSSRLRNNPSNYLYKKLEEKYNTEILMPSLEKKKQELAEHRNIYKPMNWVEIKEHEREHHRIIMRHSEEKAQEFAELKAKELSLAKLKKQVKNEISTRCELQDIKEKEERALKEKQKVELKDKMKKYSDLVKDITVIKASPKKAAELKSIISRLKHPVREARDTRKLYDLSIINNRANRIQKPVLTSVNRSQINGNYFKIVSSRGRTNPIDDGSSKSPSQTDSSKKSLKFDYLAEQRRKRERNPILISKSINWEKDLNNPSLGMEQKCNLVIGKASQIEREARIKEDLLRARGGADKNPGLESNITDMFIEAIKAKLAVLENVN